MTIGTGSTDDDDEVVDVEEREADGWDDVEAVAVWISEDWDRVVRVSPKEDPVSLILIFLDLRASSFSASYLCERRRKNE